MEMTDALERAGVSPSDIFTEPISPELVNVGLNHSADDLITYIRYALPEDKAAGDQWRKDLPLAILRVRDISPRPYHHPLEIPTYTDRKANFDETKKPIAHYLEKLQDAVLKMWGQSESGTPVITFFSAYKYLDLLGQHCLGDPDPLRGPMDCLGDTQDADYQISSSGVLDDNKVIAIMGTLSTETGNATYTSLSVNWFPELVGVLNIDDTDLKGSAKPFAKVLGHRSDLFYVFYVARDCTGLTNCREVSTDLVPTGELVKIIQRNYVNPGSTNGPDPNYVLNPVALELDGRYRPAMK